MLHHEQSTCWSDSQGGWLGGGGCSGGGRESEHCFRCIQGSCGLTESSPPFTTSSPSEQTAGLMTPNVLAFVLCLSPLFSLSLSLSALIYLNYLHAFHFIALYFSPFFLSLSLSLTFVFLCSDHLITDLCTFNTLCIRLFLFTFFHPELFSLSLQLPQPLCQLIP